MRKRKPVPRSDLDFGSPTGFRDKRAVAKDVAARDRARRSKTLSSQQQVQLLARYATLKVGPNGKKDGARPHTGKQVVERLNAIGTKLLPKIEVSTQPAQSRAST